ncbi:MAG: glycosyltransferase family 2 protein [Alistipes sp.]|jgi:GT2 family glycosyltransferase|nr:glycosyltransferase family 2 protein [Alistipes sp.]
MAGVKVVILNWNGAEVLSRFLPSVVASVPPGVEVVVADNGSTDGSAELVRRGFPSVRVVTLDRNYGFAGGYNRALRGLDADYFILLNNDVETPPGWCEPLVEMLEARPEIAAVAPKILSWAARDTFEYAGASGGFIDSLGYPFCRGRILDTLERDRGQYDDAREVFWATGACLACRAEVFRTLGGFDESFFAHQEEIDLCWRIWSAGWRVMVEPRSCVWHLGAGTLPPSPQKLYLNYRNNLAMLYKNLPCGTMQAVVAVRVALNTLAALVYLLRGERENWRAVWRAHRDFVKMVGTPPPDLATRKISLRDSRRLIRATRVALPSGVYRGAILLAHIFGRRKFSELKFQSQNISVH